MKSEATTLALLAFPLAIFGAPTAAGVSAGYAAATTESTGTFRHSFLESSARVPVLPGTRRHRHRSRHRGSSTTTPLVRASQVPMDQGAFRLLLDLHSQNNENFFPFLEGRWGLADSGAFPLDTSPVKESPRTEDDKVSSSLNAGWNDSHVDVETWEPTLEKDAAVEEEPPVVEPTGLVCPKGNFLYSRDKFPYLSEQPSGDAKEETAPEDLDPCTGLHWHVLTRCPRRSDRYLRALQQTSFLSAALNGRHDLLVKLLGAGSCLEFSHDMLVSTINAVQQKRLDVARMRNAEMGRYADVMTIQQREQRGLRIHGWQLFMEDLNTVMRILDAVDQQ